MLLVAGICLGVWNRPLWSAYVAGGNNLIDLIVVLLSTWVGGAIGAVATKIHTTVLWVNGVIWWVSFDDRQQRGQVVWQAGILFNAVLTAASTIQAAAVLRPGQSGFITQFTHETVVVFLSTDERADHP